MLKRISKKLKLMKYVKSYLGNDIYRISNRKNEKKCGLLNKNGEILMDAIYNELYVKDNYILLYKDDAYTIYDISANKEVVSDIQIDNDTIQKSAPWLILDNGDKKALFNTENNNSQGPQYEFEELSYLNCDSKNNAYFIAKKDGKFALLKNNQNVLPYEFDNIEEGATPEIVLAQKNDKSNLYKVIELYKNTGKKLTEDAFYAVDNKFFFNNYFRVFTGGRVGLMDINGKYFVDCNYTKIKKFKNFDKNYQYRTSKSSYGYTTSYQVDYSKYLAVVKGNGLYGCINENGTEIIPCIFDDIEVDYDNIEVEILGKTFVLNNRNFASIIESIISAPELVSAVNVEDCMKKIHAWENSKPEKQDNEMKEYRILPFQLS